MNGLLNRLWFTDTPAHKRAKPFVMHGKPEQRGGSLVWSWTWLDDMTDPPTDLQLQVGRVWRIGDDRCEVVAVTAGAQYSFDDLLAPARFPSGVQRVDLTAHTPVIVPRGSRLIEPRRDRLFGIIPHPGQSALTLGEREFGVFSVAEVYGSESFSAELVAAARLAVPLMHITAGQGGWVAHDAEFGRQGWTGTVQLRVRSADPVARAALTTLAAMAEVTGLGAGTAYGYGCVSAQGVRAGLKAELEVSAKRRPEFSGVLFEDR